MSNTYYPSTDKIDFLRDIRLATRIDLEPERKTPWSQRDEFWFRNDAAKVAKLKILDLLFEEDESDIPKSLPCNKPTSPRT